MSVKGIDYIKIPIKASDFLKYKTPEEEYRAIEPYISGIISQFTKISQGIQKDYDVYLLDQPILNKQRPHSDSVSNNKVIVPDLSAMVNWKTGYLFGNPIKYAQNEDIGTDDINYLNKYLRYSRKRSTDKEVGKWVYATGVGYYFIEPASEDRDLRYEAPYDIYCIPSTQCIKVYSSFIGEKPLFDLVFNTYVEKDREGNLKTVSVYNIYTNRWLHIIEDRNGLIGANKEYTYHFETRGTYKPLPLVEKRANKEGIGIIALVETMQDAINTLISDGVDNIEDMVNDILVYINVTLGKTTDEKIQTHRAFMENGLIELMSQQGVDADVKRLSRQSTLKDIEGIVGLLDVFIHRVVGVPLEISNTNSGGTTKQGSEVSNGYDNAYNRALDDINSFMLADTDLLEKMLFISNLSPDNPIELKLADIEIKYSINLADNMLVKSQTYGTFIQTMPPKLALAFAKISSDPEADGKVIEDSEAYKKFIENGEKSAQSAGVGIDVEG